MSDDYLKVNYDSQTRTWKSDSYPFEALTKRSVSEAFLESMRSLEPNKVLEYHFDENKEKSAKDLYQESIIVANNLQRLGMRKGDVVLLFSGYNYVTSSLTFGTILMGGVVNFFEVKLENEDIDKLFEIIQPFMILYEEVFLLQIVRSLKRKKPKSLKYMFAIDSCKFPNVSTQLLKSSDSIDFDNFEALLVEKPESEVTFLVLTSGSTGLPKVTQLTHCLLLNGIYVWWVNPPNYEPVNSTSLLFSLSPLRWISQVGLLLQSALLGIKRICANKASTGRYGLEILRKTKPTHIFSVPSFFYEILLQLEEGDQESLDSLKYILLGGEPLSTGFINLCKRFAVNSKIFCSYGMSEVSGPITNDEYMSGGKLQHGLEVQVLDDNLQPVGHDVPGQLAVKTPYPFVGYKDPANNHCFLENGFFLNGDYGYFDDNNTLHLLGRLKDLIRYQNILLIPNSIEPLVLSLAEISSACLVGYQCSDESPCEVAALFVILEEGVTADHELLSTKIRDALSSHLSQDQMLLIHDIHFEKSLPLTTCGKTDRVALKKLALEMKTSAGN